MSKQIDQKVTGAVRVDDRPGTGLSLRLQGDGNPCDSGSMSLTTDANGSFSGARTAYLGRMAVIVQKDTLCVLDGQNWHPVWNGIYGPAPETMNFQCDHSGAQEWKCKMNGLDSHDRKA